MLPEEYLLEHDEQSLKQEYIRIRRKLVNKNSAVKNRDDVRLNTCLAFIRNALEDLYGVPYGELVALDNPSPQNNGCDRPQLEKSYWNGLTDRS